MKKITLIILSFSLLIAFQVPAQKYVDFTVGAGYTAVDIDKAAESFGDEADDWDQFMWQIDAQFFFHELGNGILGVDVGYQNLYWYEDRISTTSGTRFDSWFIGSGHVGPIYRWGVDNNPFVDVGMGLYILGGDPQFGISGAVGWAIPVGSGGFSIPIKLRTDLILAETITLPVGLSAGVRYQID